MIVEHRRAGRAALVAVVAALSLASPAQAAAAKPLTVVELFQSQGCSSCPPANENINALADRPELLVLSYGVTYWDNLGWKDTFASPCNTARQWAYARGLRRSNVGTPQVVLNGRQDLVGTDRPVLEAAIRSAAPLATAQVVFVGDEVQVRGAGSGYRAADVWLVRYDPRIEWVPIRRGENGGKTLPHRNIVKQFVRLGRWTGGARVSPDGVARLRAHHGDTCPGRERRPRAGRSQTVTRPHMRPHFAELPPRHPRMRA